MKRRSVILLAILLALSCKAEKAADSRTTDTAAMEPPSAPQAELARSVVTSTAAGAATPAGPQAPAMPRIVIRNAQLTMVVGDAGAVADKLVALAASSGGYVADSKQWRESEQLRATMTMRIPAQRLDATLAAARKLAVRVESENVDANDVTQEYVDLDSQVRNLEAAETEMRALMTDVRERMKKAEDILEIYQQLTQLRGQIETAKGRMRYLSQMSALATIKVDLIPDVLAKPVVAPGWQPVAIARDASRTLVRTLQALATIAIWCAIYLLPVALLFVIAGLIVRAIVRAVRKRSNV